VDTNAGLPLESTHDFYVKQVPPGSRKGEFVSSAQ